jgi:hypothetical protein
MKRQCVLSTDYGGVYIKDTEKLSRLLKEKAR